jgi:purine-binding chemotaxis protein CheW
MTTGGQRARPSSDRARERRDAEAAGEADLLQMVTFAVGVEEFGLDINAITEAIRPLSITQLPHMPPFIEGVINLRGMIIPVVDLRKRFAISGERTDPRKTRMIITRGALPGTAAGGPLGLVVDGVREVVHVPRSQIEPAPAAARGSGAECISGVAKLASRLIILVDIAKVLSREERTVLAEADDVDP